MATEPHGPRQEGQPCCGCGCGYCCFGADLHADCLCQHIRVMNCAGALDNEEFFIIEGSENWRSTPGQPGGARKLLWCCCVVVVLLWCCCGVVVVLLCLCLWLWMWLWLWLWLFRRRLDVCVWSRHNGQCKTQSLRLIGGRSPGSQDSRRRRHPSCF